MMLNKEAAEARSFNSLGQGPSLPVKRSPGNRIFGALADAGTSSVAPFVLFGFCVAFAHPMTLLAQTAQFSAETRALGSGFFNPSGVAVDGNGNVFVGDTYNKAVKEIVAVGGSIPATPTIRTLGSGFSFPVGVAVDGSGNVFVADIGNGAVYEMLAVSGSVPASPTIRTLGSGFKQPWGVAIDGSGNVYVADRDEAIYEMLAVNGSIPTNPTINTLGSGFSEPTGVAVDGSGNVYVAESDTSAVKEMLAVNGSIPTSPTIRTLSSGFTNPFGIAVDASGNVYVADTSNSAVKEMLAVGGSIPVSPTIETVGVGFSGAEGVAVDANGNVFVADSGKAVIEIPKVDGFGPVTVGASSFVISNYFTFDSTVTLYGYGLVTQGAHFLDFTDAGTGTCQAGTAYNAGDYCSVDVMFKPTAPGLRSGAVQLVSGSALLATAYVHGTGVGPRVNFLPAQQSTPVTGLGNPYGLATDALGDVYFADAVKNTVTEVVATNGVIRANPGSINLGSGFSGPRGVAVDGAANVFVADYGNGEVKEMLALDEYADPRPVGSGFVSPSAVAVDGSGNVFVADAGNGTVKEILVSFNYANTVTLASGFSSPAGIAVDAYGNVYVTDYTAGTVHEILAVDGAIPTNPTIVSLGSGFSGPWGIAVDANGNVIVGDYGHNAVKELVAVNGVIPSSPTINTLGSGWSGPSGVVVDEHGVVYVSNSSAGTIAELDYADPPSLQFASTPVGSISSDGPKSITVVNGGTAPLNAVPPGLSVPPDFKLVSGSGTPSDCTETFSLVAGEGCNLSIEFAPQTAGNPLSESLVLTDNSLNAGPTGSPSQSILLSGTGLTPKAVSLSATSLSFGSEKVGSTSASQSVTLTNTGTAPLTITSIAVTGADASSFGFANSCGTSVTAGGSCTIHGHFTPASGGAMTAAVTIRDNAADSPQSITLSGTGLTPPSVTLSASNLSFASEKLGSTSASQSVTLTNTGTAPLTITGIAVTGKDVSSFGFANSCGTSLAAGANCTIHGHFTPEVSGALTAAVTINNNAANSPQSISLSGTGLTPPAVTLSATNLSFGSEKVGSTSASQSVTLTNTGTAPLTITSIEVTGTDASSFVFANSCGTSVAGGASCTIHGHFTPAATGALSAAISITDNASGAPQSIALSGTGN